MSSLKKEKKKAVKCNQLRQCEYDHTTVVKLLKNWVGLVKRNVEMCYYV